MPPIFSKQEKEAILQNLLGLGLSEIKKKGFKKISIDSITEQAGIGKGTFYHFFDSKQSFLMEIIRSYQKRKFTEFEDRIAQVDSMSIEDVFQWYQSFRQDQDNPLLYMSSIDAAWMKENLPREAIYHEDGDIEVAKLLLSKVNGIRKDIDYAVVANIPKIIFLTMEHREELHQEGLPQNIDMMLQMLKNYLGNCETRDARSQS